MERNFYILNVFSDSGIRGGNQLGVIPEAQGLSNEEMQTITRQLNYSECTFITSMNEEEADVRIFTPRKEIEYAGHPSIGTLYLIEWLNRKKTQNPRVSYKLNLKGGTIYGSYEVNDRKNDNSLGIVKFEQVNANIIGEFDDRNKVLKLLGIQVNDLANDLPFYIISVTSMKFLFVHVKNADILRAITPDLNGLRSGDFKENDISVYVFCKSKENQSLVRARFFVPLYGIAEDPATGGIQSSFGLALLKHDILKEGVNNIVVEQGAEIGRPSRIYDEFYVKEGELIKTITGGNCYLFSEGKLSL